MLSLLVILPAVAWMGFRVWLHGRLQSSLGNSLRYSRMVSLLAARGCGSHGRLHSQFELVSRSTRVDIGRAARQVDRGGYADRHQTATA